MNRFTRRFAVSSVALLVAMTAGALAAPAVLASPPAAPAGGEVSLRPLHPDSATPSYFTFRAAAGSSVHDTVVITNYSSEPVSLAISAVDGMTGQTTGSVYANRKDPVREAGKWVAVEADSLTLQAKSSRMVSFTVAVPADAAAGDHLAGIAVENTVPVESSNGFAIRQIIRSVIGVRVIVPGSARFVPKLTSLGIKQVGQTDIGAVHVGLANAGLQLAKPTLKVSVASSAGYSKALTRELDTVLPGDAITYPFAWPDRLQPGDYAITATLTGGGKTVTMHRTVHLGAALAGVNQPLPKVITKDAKGLSPAVLIAVILGGALVFGAVVGVVMRRSRRRPLKRQQG